MSLMRFGSFFRELAERETRVITVKAPVKVGRVVLPADEYGFDEWYCVEAGCDCRRVLIQVLARYAQAHVATISHGFDRPTRPHQLPEQTYLDPILPQSKWSEALLDLFVNMALADTAYRQRLLGHYLLVKNAVADPAHPCQSWLKAAVARGSKLGTMGAGIAPRRRPIPPPPRRGRRKWR